MKLVFSKNTFLLATLIGCSYGGGKVMAQKLSVKTNVLTWATLSPNLGAEVILNSHISINGHLTYHPFNIKENPFRLLIVQPEIRYWVARPCSRHFVGLTTFYMDNDLVWKDIHYKGNGVAGGLSYGYNWVLSDHWNLEASVGVGMLYTRQFKYAVDELPPATINYRKWIPVPMKCGLSFVYIFK